MDMRLLSGTRTANVFFHSVGCLFTPCMGSVEEQALSMLTLPGLPILCPFLAIELFVPYLK